MLQTSMRGRATSTIRNPAQFPVQPAFDGNQILGLLVGGHGGQLPVVQLSASATDTGSIP
jgi:hypothetical protein